ncbi:hypothetical protein G5V59_15470 [Nocardioides sp. W3-2-3]|nr:hypothetical protein [Nocardioides convexus]
MTADDDLLAALLPLAAAADVAPSVARDPLTALRSWPVAPVVLVGADLAEEMLRVVPEARPRCFVVTGERAPHEALPDRVAPGSRAGRRAARRGALAGRVCSPTSPSASPVAPA